MDYTHLTADHRETLRAERVIALEADHYRSSLALAELPADAPAEQREAMSNELADLERRVAVHVVAEPAPVSAEPAEPPAKGDRSAALAAANGSKPA